MFWCEYFVPSHQSYTSSQIDNMNAWLKPYRRITFRRTRCKITEEQQFKCHIDTIIENKYLFVVLLLGFLVKNY